MDKKECKKYVRRAFNRMKMKSKSITPENIAIEIKREMDSEREVYIAYAKIAMHNLNNSATEINAKQLAMQIDVIPRLYNPIDAIIKSKDL